MTAAPSGWGRMAKAGSSAQATTLQPATAARRHSARLKPWMQSAGGRRRAGGGENDDNVGELRQKMDKQAAHEPHALLHPVYVRTMKTLFSSSATHTEGKPAAQ